MRPIIEKCEQTQNIQSRIIAELEAAPDIKPRFWTEFELGIMRKYYAKKGAETIAKCLGKSVETVKHKARAMGLVAKPIR